MIARSTQTWSARPPHGKRISELDGIRGIAVLVVMLSHFGAGAVPHGFAEKVIGTGWIGVDLFFVLSGFLITGILLNSERAGYFRRFYLRRTLRIFPVYYFFLIFIFHAALPLAQSLHHTISTHGFSEEAWYWIYLANLRDATHQSRYIRHFWSLCIEEQFYLVWPLLIFVMPRAPLKYVCVMVTLACPVLRFLAHHEGVSRYALYRMTPFRLEGLALGSLLALAAVDKALLAIVKRWLPRFSILAFVLFCGVLYHWGNDFQSYGMELCGYSSVAILASLLVFHARRFSRPLQNPVLVLLGKYSYALYVYHAPIAEQIRLHAEQHRGWVTLILVWAGGIGVSMILAIISWIALERPCAQLKERLTGSSAKAAAHA